MKATKKLAAGAIIVAMTMGTAAPVFARGGGGPGCNSGRGNGSETTPENDCDPGRSAFARGGLGNNGGD